jgi:hypothetical protein
VFVAKGDTRITLSPFTLFDQNLFNVRPGHVDMFSKTGISGRLGARNGSSSKFDVQYPAKPSRIFKDPYTNEVSNVGTSSATVFIGGSSFSLMKGKIHAPRRDRGTNLMQSGITHGADHPFNRDGYKYDLAEVNPCLKYTVFRECNVLPWRGNGVFLSREDRSPSIFISKDGLTCSGDVGFRSVRATLGVQYGAWYFEVYVHKASGIGGGINENPHLRIGISKRESSLMGPVGYDDFSFAYRDSTGEKVSNSRPKKYADPYGPGDVIGVLLTLPRFAAKPPKRKKLVPRSRTRQAHARERVPIRFKTNIYLESKDYFPPRDFPTPNEPLSVFPKLPKIPGSQLLFFKNGKCQGVAYDGLPAPIPEVCSKLEQQGALFDDGSLGFFPSVSCYSGGKATVNFGPNFIYPLPHAYNPFIDPPPNCTKRTYPPENAFNSDQSTSNISKEGSDCDHMDVCNESPSVPPIHASNPSPPSIWKPYSDVFFEHEVEQCVWDVVDEVEYWWAYEHTGNRSSVQNPPLLLDRSDEASLRPIPDIVFPGVDETYEDHIARETRIRIGKPTLKDLLIPRETPARRVRVKWALTEEPY